MLFTIHWVNGKQEVIKASSIEEAFSRFNSATLLNQVDYIEPTEVPKEGWIQIEEWVVGTTGKPGPRKRV